MQPNCSATWKQTQLFLLVISIPSLIIASIWSFLGFWLVLPFAGLELGLLAFLMHRVCYKTHTRQRISFEDKVVRIQSGVYQLEDVKQFERGDVFLWIKKPVKPMDMLELHLRDEQSDYEVGAFLNNDDRKLARSALKKAGLAETLDRWWEKESFD
nr:DUF2244 domain-containing protein [Pleionea sp. CnH1-48]